MARTSRFSREVRERAVRLVFEHRGEYASEWEAMGSIASKIGCTAETLQRENRELRRANEILKKASAYFAQAELDRRPK
jgi:transposase-like protein